MNIKTKPDATKTYYSIESWSSGNGADEVSVKRGQRLRGDHPAVARQLQWFVPCDGLSDDDVKAAERSARAAAGLDYGF